MQRKGSFHITHSFSERAVTIKRQGEPAVLFASLGEAGKSALPGYIECVSQLQKKVGFDTVALF